MIHGSESRTVSSVTVLLPLTAIFVFQCLIGHSLASQDCIEATGVLICNLNQSYVVNAEVLAYDRDSRSVFNWVDPDDLMGTTHVFTEDGAFEIHGCANDRDWLFALYENKIEPYLVIKHHCNKYKKRIEKTLGIFQVFKPRIKKFGDIILDDNDDE